MSFSLDMIWDIKMMNMTEMNWIMSSEFPTIIQHFASLFPSGFQTWWMWQVTQPT